MTLLVMLTMANPSSPSLQASDVYIGNFSCEVIEVTSQEVLKLKIDWKESEIKGSP